MAGFPLVFARPNLRHRGPPGRIFGHVAADALRMGGSPLSRHESIALRTMVGQALPSRKRPEPHIS